MHRTNIKDFVTHTSQAAFIPSFDIPSSSRRAHRAPFFLRGSRLRRSQGSRALASTVAIALPLLVAGRADAARPTRSGPDRPSDTRTPRDRVFMAQAETNKPAAAPQEHPPALTTPVGPDKEKAPPQGTNVGPTAPTTGTTPGTGTTVPAPSVAASNDAEGRQIVGVRVVGNRVIAPDVILLQIGAKPGAAYTARQSELDRANIDRLGFFASVQVQVTANVEDPEKVDVTYIVVENRPVTAIKFTGNNLVSEADLLKVISTRIGSLLNRNTVGNDVNKIQELFRQRGFAALVLDAQQQPDGTLVFTIQEARISRIDISGLRKTQPSIVRRQIRVKPGDPFDQKRIRTDLNRIYDLGFFDDVTFKVEDDPDAPGAVIVTIGVKEKRTGTFSLGVGFDSRSRISGFVTISENNLRGTGKRASASVELGSQRTFDLSYGDPFVGKKNASYDIDIFNRRIFREPRSVQNIIGQPATGTTQTFSYEEERTGARINVAIPRDEDKTKSWLFGYRNERARLFQTTDFTVVQPVNLPPDASGRVSAFSGGLLRDKRDLRLDPSSGDREQIILEKGLRFLGGTASFSKIDLDLRKYVPLIGPPKPDELPKLVLAGRAVIGRSFGQLPAFEQYFIGGSDTVRGYDVDEQFGDNQVYTNVELRYRIQRKFQIVGFVDNGSAYGGQFASSTSYKNLFGYGVGLRVQTPIGPIRLDIGKGTGGVKTHFAIGPTF